MNEPASVPRLERLIGRVLQAGIITSTVCFIVGLVLSISGATAAASILLNAGVVVLLATPVTRVLVSIVEYVNQRDWMFVTLTAVVLAELVASVILALAFRTRL